MKDKHTEQQIPQMPGDPKEAEALIAALTKKKKLAGLFGIARKAGRVIAGTNLVVDGIRSGSPSRCPSAVFLASDVSDNTRKRVKNSCEYYQIPLYDIPLTVAEIGGAIGKSGSISAVGITDSGLSDALAKLI
ncbi:MAG: ribosomal L7Ae/L30e/S12e/Gadd45 family protein [Clostridia bacterium]|nr:ribosomal L7Ae/L30e/S12e/Gadd45 family protein [Clostridia bacterium]MBO5670894.1 ribosomal L7Ae/L30e/S12e/Gadd45 family protein [Clostridia bacterium]